ncbi:isopenicillin N synthase-like dioxygenase [Acinetobacter calcoaceticus]|uniref:Isopenicillin N synthase-like dioxygenase n=1 Tax=Acinetobacter calcoaceticus TaxID=471 RepID=A0A4R1XAT9_ACICA|nr:isopenicillin N synthase-like dioxygenase [Acinetobacter calcoaceticus]
MNTITSAKAFDHVPVIDLHGLYSQDLQQQLDVAAQLRFAAENIGFFYIKGHHIPQVQIDRLRSQAKVFFALPFEEKMKYYAGLHGIKHRGYVPPGEEQPDQNHHADIEFTEGGNAAIDPPTSKVDLIEELISEVYKRQLTPNKADNKEAFDLSWDLAEDDPDALAQKPMHGANVWADLPDFKKDVSTYYHSVIGLGRVLLRGFELALELEPNQLNALVNKPTSQLRLLHYPHNIEAEDIFGFGAHTDMELFTILLPTAPGLEVVNAAGQWIDVPPIENTFVVNIGDMIEALSGGRFVATSHRVRKVIQERYAFPLFFACDYDVEIKPLPRFATPEAIEKYPTLIAGQHLFEISAKVFKYMQKMIKNGDIVLSAPKVQFGQSVEQSNSYQNQDQ